jgi:hypothetical protein
VYSKELLHIAVEKAIFTWWHQTKRLNLNTNDQLIIMLEHDSIGTQQVRINWITASNKQLRIVGCVDHVSYWSSEK